MKKNYILGLAAMTAFAMAATLPAEAAQPAPKKLAKLIKKNAKKRAGEKAIWCAETHVLSVWDGEDWEESEKYEFRYDSDGRVLQETVRALIPGEESATRTTNTYNENGELAVRISEVAEDGTEFENSEKLERKYDERLTSVIVDNAAYMWNEGSWMLRGNNYRRYITRNADGNITRVVVAVLYDGEYDPTQMLDIEYGEDKKASKIVSSFLTTDDGLEFYWAEDGVYSDIVWERTDGQIYDTDYLIGGANAIKSCKVIDEDGDEQTVTVEYLDALGSYKAVTDAVFDGEAAHSEVVVTVFDEYGSNQMVYNDVYGEGEEAETEYGIERYMYDAYDLETEAYIAGGMDEETAEVYQWSKADVTYDANEGYPLEYTLAEYDYETEEMFNALRIVYSDYVDAAGVADIAADDASAPVELYNLQGIRVNGDAAPGIYIRRQGSKTAKVIIK